MTPWDNPTVDALLFALVVLLVAALTIRWGPRFVRRNDDLYDLHPPVSEPIWHVNVDDVGRVLKVGLDCHSQACVDDEGRVLCVCGLDAA